MSEPNQQPASEQPPGDKTVPVPPSNLPPYQGQPPAGGYQQPQYQQNYLQQQPQYQQNYPQQQPQYQQNYPPQYQQSNQPHYQTYTSGVNATSGLLGRLSLGRKIVLFAGIIALLARFA